MRARCQRIVRELIDAILELNLRGICFYDFAFYILDLNITLGYFREWMPLFWFS